MARDFVVDDRQLSRYITQLTGVPRAVGSRSARWVRRMTRVTERNMKKFSRSRTERSTGELSSSISSRYNLTNQFVEGVVYVPPSVKHQFAAEYGIQRRTVIQGNPRMTFPTSSWKKAGRVASVPHRGYFVFTRVVRGRYKGKHFTERSFKKLLQYYEQNKTKIMGDVGDAILFARA